MEILYFGSACNKEWFNEVSYVKSMPYSVAQYKFELALIGGFESCEDINMKIYYQFQESYYPKGKYLLFKSKKEKLTQRFKVTYLSFINIPLLKETYYFLEGLFLTLKWVMKNNHQKDKIILTPYNYSPLSFGILIVAKLFKVKRINIFTDLSTDIMNSHRQKEMAWIKKKILPYYLKMVNYLERNYDMYILFTENMNQKVNPQKKPSLVIEGIYNNEHNLSKSNKVRALMHAGTLSFEYGVKYILDAFEQIDDKDLQLWLFGNGDMREYIIDLCRRDNRVHYFGFRPHNEVFEYEKKAMLLINIRNPKDEYTKYSFPSKTFEYMASGTPYLTTKLEGIPDEYYDYMYTLDNLEIESIKLKIIEIISKPKNELENFGLQARQFILDKKNSIVQTRKIIDRIKRLLN